MARATVATVRNIRVARQKWGRLPRLALTTLEELIREYRLSIALGDVLYLGGRWYVTHVGLVRLATRKHCSGIRVSAVREFCDPPSNRLWFKATVYKSLYCKGFVVS